MVTDSIDWTYIFLFFSLRTEKKKSVLERSTATTSSCQLTLSHGKSASDLEFKYQLKPTWVCGGVPSLLPSPNYPQEIVLKSQGAQLRALWGPRWVGWRGGPRERGYMYTYSCSLSCRAENNSIL